MEVTPQLVYSVCIQEGAYGKHTQGLLAAGWGTTIVPAVRIEVLGGGGYARFAVSDCDYRAGGSALHSPRYQSPQRRRLWSWTLLRARSLHEARAWSG